ncbi:MAG TPA: Gfo/Idh/MocA family oxidoreductase [Candidatus Nanopelagicaceae bacterium]|nr:Gfo/Idh/MocA family oxidoreductase [Candidatus Nanopelagicaceae bacterium]
MTEPPLRWGILGAADIAEKAVMPAIQGAGGELAALASRNPERGRALASRFQIPRLCLSYQELVEGDLDAVYIPLPNSLHLPWALRAAAAGKHVLCEKPLALTAEEARQMTDAAQVHQVVLAEAVMYRYHPRWQTVHRLIREGEIGHLRHLQGSFTFSLGPPPDIRWEKDLGGGALYDVGSYLVNAGRWLAGEPTRVLARAQLRHGVDSDGSLLLEFQSSGGPVSAELAYSFESAEHQNLQLIGTKGSLQIRKPFTAWRGESIPLFLRREADGDTEMVATPAADPYQEMVETFTARIRGGPALPTGPEDAEMSLRVLDAARRSLGSATWEMP